MASVSAMIETLPDDIIDKIYKTRFEIDIQEVHLELNNVRSTYPGDFSQHPDDFMQDEGPGAYEIITELNAWDIMKMSPPSNTGYMFWQNSEVQNLMSQIERRQPGHSGASLGFLMQHMHYIAVHGWDAYYEKFINNLNT